MTIPLPSVLAENSGYQGDSRTTEQRTAKHKVLLKERKGEKNFLRDKHISKSDQARIQKIFPGGVQP